MKKIILSLSAVLILSSCGAPPPPPPRYGQQPGYGQAMAPVGQEPIGPNGKPVWVDGQPVRHSSQLFLTAVGHGPTQPQAESDAYAALGKIFEAHVSQVSQDTQTYFSRVSSYAPGVRVESMNIASLTRVSTDKVMRGARIAEHWAGDGAHHCLAVLEREPAAASLREEIRLIDAQIDAQVKKGDTATEPTARFMAYAEAMRLLQQREALNVDLRIVEGRGMGVPASVDFATLVAKFTESKSKIKIGLKLSGNEAMKIQTCLAEALTKSGMEILEGSSDVDAMIEGTLKYQKAGEIAGSVMVRADVNLRVMETQNGKTLSAFTDDIKVGRPTLEQSVQLAVSKLCDQVVPKLEQKIRASFSK